MIFVIIEHMQPPSICQNYTFNIPSELLAPTGSNPSKPAGATRICGLAKPLRQCGDFH